MAFLKDENIYDVIVVGVGSMGSSACYHLANAGLKVLGLEQFGITHERGSHSGQSRFVRMAYFEHPDYVPLLKRAYQNWEDIEALSGEYLFRKSGIVYFGTSDSIQISGVKESASIYDLPIEKLGKDEVKNRFHQFDIPDDYEALLEANAGFVSPEKTIKTYVKYATASGAKILTKTKLRSWESHSGIIRCKTSKGTFSAKKIVFTAGGWTQRLLPKLQSKLQVTQQSLLWYRPDDISDFKEQNFMCWSITDPDYDGMFYGFPIFDGEDPTMKLAYHSRGIEKIADEKNDLVSQEELAPLEFFFDKYMPEFKGEMVKTKTCLYNYSEDEDFIIDSLPGYDDNVIVACGFSGHGFKFVPVIGEIIKDLVTKGKSELPIEFLKMR